MTTTNVYQGLGDGSRASSKVLKPPGGGSSNIFGDPEPARGRPQQQQQHQTNVLGQPLGQGGSGQQPMAADVAYGGPDRDQNNAALQASPAGAPSAGPPQDVGRFSSKKQGQDSFNNIFGGDGQQQGGQRGRRKGDGTYNPITGEDYEQSPQAHRNASRVTNPPGGKSTGLW